MSKTSSKNQNTQSKPNIKRDGEGIIFFQDSPDNLKYEGGIKNGKYHGNGVLYYKNQDKKLEGEFENGVENGRLVYYSKYKRKKFQGFSENGVAKLMSSLLLFSELINLQIKKKEAEREFSSTTMMLIC